MEKELKQAIELFLVSNNVNFNREELRLQLLTHPYFPSINAITDLFDHFKIDNIAAQLPQEKSIIAELPSTFLAHIKEGRSESIVLVIKKKDKLKLVFSSQKNKYVDYDEFIESWTGVIVAIEKETPGFSSKIQAKSILKTGSYILLSMLFVLAMVINPLELVGFNYLAITIIGLYTSMLLVRKELGLHSRSLDKFCEASEKSSCDSILNSKGALLFGLFKLSDIGIIYFSSIALTFLVSRIFSVEVNYSLFYIISAASVLFIPYSLYYQWKVVKKWCPLCLIILGVLLLQAVTLLAFIPLRIVEFGLIDALIVIFSFLFTSVLWTELKSGLKSKQDHSILQLEHYKFKRNSNLFLTALQSTEKKDIAIEGINEITFGNETAQLKIVLVTNPMCSFCKEAHQVFHNIIKERGEDIQLIIRFSINTSAVEGNLGLEITNELLTIYHEQSEDTCMLALDEIYSDMNANDWIKKWKKSTAINHLDTLEKQKEWCTKNAINFTPAILVNGYQFPKEYNRTDITFFIDDIIENDL